MVTLEQQNIHRFQLAVHDDSPDHGIRWVHVSAIESVTQ